MFFSKKKVPAISQIRILLTNFILTEEENVGDNVIVHPLHKRYLCGRIDAFKQILRLIEQIEKTEE